MSTTGWLIVGLGNPGKQYAHTRHNLGARVVEATRKALGHPAFRASRTLRARVSHGTPLLAIPTTFMNDSGRAVRALLRAAKLHPDSLLVVHDDKDLAFGRIKLQNSRSAAGHRGVQSIIDELGTKVFWRLRVGIGPPPSGIETDVYVLARFTPAEEQAVQDTVIPRAIDQLRQHIGGP